MKSGIGFQPIYTPQVCFVFQSRRDGSKLAQGRATEERNPGLMVTRKTKPQRGDPNRRHRSTPIIP